MTQDELDPEDEEARKHMKDYNAQVMMGYHAECQENPEMEQERQEYISALRDALAYVSTVYNSTTAGFTVEDPLAVAEEKIGEALRALMTPEEHLREGYGD